MRRLSELSGNIRGYVRSTAADQVWDGEKMVPNALAVLAAAEARFLYWMVKLSGCREQL